MTKQAEESIPPFADRYERAIADPQLRRNLLGFQLGRSL